MPLARRGGLQEAEALAVEGEEAGARGVEHVVPVEPRHGPPEGGGGEVRLVERVDDVLDPGPLLGQVAVALAELYCGRSPWRWRSASVAPEMSTGSRASKAPSSTAMIGSRNVDALRVTALHSSPMAAGRSLSLSLSPRVAVCMHAAVPCCNLALLPGRACMHIYTRHARWRCNMMVKRHNLWRFLLCQKRGLVRRVSVEQKP